MHILSALFGAGGEERMFIQEAVRKALENQSVLKRTGWEKEGVDVIVIPGNRYMPLDIDRGGKSQCRKPNWNPTPEDLMADDWEVTKV